MAGVKRKLSTAEGSVSPPTTKRTTILSTTTKTAVNAFFKPTSQKDPEKTIWRIVNNTLLVARYEPLNKSEPETPQRKRRKVAAFDFDSTLIVSLSGRRFGRDAADWKWCSPVVPGTLQELNQDGYQIVVLSNQAGLSLKPDPKTIKSDTKRLADFKAKVNSVLNQLNLPVSLYAATERDMYRKPRIGMWKEVIDNYDLEVEGSIDLDGSTFVGDAGGRVGSGAGGVSKDHACSDRDFAFNVGITFKTPEEFFLRQEPRPFRREFDPSMYVSPLAATSTDASPMLISKKNSLDIVLLCGSPGSGKSTFYWKHLQPLGYERVNQDILKTRDKCLKAAADFIERGSSVAVDNTNADPETRAEWVNVARKLGVPIRCVLFTANARLCEHNNAVRALSGALMNPEQRTMLPRMAFTGFTSRYREPKAKEGFQDIVRVDFAFEGGDEQRAIWSRYWI